MAYFSEDLREDMQVIGFFCWAGLVVITLLLTILYIVGKAIVMWGKRNSRIISYADIPLPELGAFDGQDVSCTCEHSCKKHERLPESMVVGSNFTKVPISKIPKTQVALYSVNERGAVVQFLGSGIRLGDYFVVPNHIIIAYDCVAALIMKPNEPAQAIKIRTDEFDLIDGDIAALRMDEAKFSRLGLVKATIASLESETIVTVCSSSKEPDYSLGTLVNDSNVFGSVVFRGSTKGGFSGSAYMMGKQIVGMHLGGGMVNYGVSASYIMALLVKPEDTAEWLQRVRRRRGPVKYQRSKFNPDEAVVFINGRYHTVDLSALDTMDVQEDTGRYAEQQQVRQPEVNRMENFPPGYIDVADKVVDVVNKVTDENEQFSLNFKAAEEISAEQLQKYDEWYKKANSQLEEVAMLLQSMQDSVANRYREIEKMLLEVKGEGREPLVEENERLKKELTAIKHLKTAANVEMSSVKATHPKVKKARAKKNNATLLDKVAGQFKIDEVIRALEEQGLVKKIAVAGTMIASEDGVVTKVSTSALPSTSQKCD